MASKRHLSEFWFSGLISPKRLKNTYTLKFEKKTYNQMVHANLKRNFPFGSFAYHLHKPWTDRFNMVNIQ